MKTKNKKKGLCPFKLISGEYRILWDCGHQYNGRNTKRNPNNYKENLKFGCPVPNCNCKKVRETDFKK